MTRKLILSSVLLAAAAATAAALPVRADSLVTIGTGAVTGVYFPLGGAICRLVNKERKQHGVSCSAEPGGGSIFNLKAVRAGEFSLGIAQSDWQSHALHGTGKFKDQGADRELRSVFSVHSELFTVVARPDSGIRTFADLQGKLINIGNPGSGQRGTMELLIESMGWTSGDIIMTAGLNAGEQSKALCDGRIDAMIYIAGHPAGSVKEATNSCDATLIAVTGPAVDRLVAGSDLYRKAAIPGGMYRGNPDSVETFGVTATLVSTTRVPAATVYLIVKSVFENLDSLRGGNPVFRSLEKERMIKDGLSAPLHDGALRYYREAGLM